MLQKSKDIFDVAEKKAGAQIFGTPKSRLGKVGEERLIVTAEVCE